MKRFAAAFFVVVCALFVIAPCAAFADDSQVTLGDFNAATSTFDQAIVTGDVNTLTVTVENKGTIADTSDALAKNLDGTSATFKVESAEAAQDKLRALVISGTDETTKVDVAVDGNTTSIPEGSLVTFMNGHYYMWVSGVVSWTDAYNAAKSYSYEGMQGYLATITSNEEYTALRQVSTVSSWVGGTIMVYADGSQISDQSSLTQTEGAFKYMQDYGQTPSAGYGKTKTYPQYYWACGPEAGTKPYDQGVDSGSSSEPNAYRHKDAATRIPAGVENKVNMIEWECCLVANNGGQAVINDITEAGEISNNQGYFVEFGGYDEGEDPGNPDETKTADDSYTFAHEHVFTYTANGNVITATCSGTKGTCDLPDGKATLTVTVPVESKDYDGGAVEAEFGTDDEVFTWAGVLDDYSTLYFKKVGDKYETTEDTTLPGEYYAAISLDNNDCTAYAAFTINRLAIEPTVSIEGWTEGEKANEPKVEGNLGNGAVTYEYKKKGASDSTYTTTVPTKAGQYIVRATIAETDIYHSGACATNFVIAEAGPAKKLPQTGDAAGVASAVAVAGTALAGMGVLRRRK